MAAFVNETTRSGVARMGRQNIHHLEARILNVFLLARFKRKLYIACGWGIFRPGYGRIMFCLSGNASSPTNTCGTDGVGVPGSGLLGGSESKLLSRLWPNLELKSTPPSLCRPTPPISTIRKRHTHQEGPQSVWYKLNTRTLWSLLHTCG